MKEVEMEEEAQEVRGKMTPFFYSGTYPSYPWPSNLNISHNNNNNDGVLETSGDQHKRQAK